MDMHRHRKLNEQQARQRSELEQAYWYARTAQNRSGLSFSARLKWRDHAERAAESLRQMGVFVEGR